eukprot:scaffold333_cov133-Cylindrotheca_fusiformis.AAC.43
MESHDVDDLSFPELLERKQAILERLQRIEIKDAPRKKTAKQKSTSSEDIPYSPKTDTHWDFVMKEMMWLGADFQGERKRQLSLAKKCASSVKQYHKTKETRRLRELQSAETKRRKLAAKIGRDVKSWWTKIERVISYKQKLKADDERQKAMNKQLVVLVQQTERYSESLTKYKGDDTSDSGDDDTSRNSDSDYPNRSKKRLTIEEALAMERRRKSKYKVVDYARMRLDNKKFYGESTASDSGSDASFSPDSDTDDETTLMQAIDDELQERKQPGTNQDIEFQADPEELRKLHEETEMDIEKVIERFKVEGMTEIPEETQSRPDSSPLSTKRVQFRESTSEQEGTDRHDADATSFVKAEPEDPGNDADDDGDASDVEDYNHDNSDDDEFSDCEPAVDDETTIAQEERLPRDMGTKEEIDLLKKESEMSVEELRRLYSGMNEGAGLSDGLAEEADEIVDLSTYAAEDVNGDANSEQNSSERKKDLDNTSGGLGTTLLEGDDSDDFYPEPSEAVDDETTIEAEEKLGRELSHDEEMDLLKKESEIPIEQLRAMYADVNGQFSLASQDLPPDSAMAMLSASANSDEDIEDYQMNETEEVDDETTLEAEERLGRDISYEEEMAVLKAESEIPIEQLRSMYQSMTDKEESSESDSTDIAGPTNAPISTAAAFLSNADDMDLENEEYTPNVEETIDDETTMEAEERLGRDMSYEDELELLKKESEMSVEELRTMYSNQVTANSSGEEEAEKMDVDEKTPPQSTTSILLAGSKRKSLANNDTQSMVKKRREDESNAVSDDGATALGALEASAERARKTLASRPYLLAHWVKLREYQQVGLNWLVSLQSRRLNGILADGE